MSIQIPSKEDFQHLLNELSAQKTQLLELTQQLQYQSNQFKHELARYQSEFTRFQTEIKTSLGNATSDSASISSTLNNVRQYQSDISKIKSEIDNARENYQIEKNEYGRLINLMKETYTQTSQDLTNGYDELDKLQKELKNEEEKIKNILGDANRASMAQSFLERKLELNRPIEDSATWRNWGLVLMAGLVLIIICNEWTQPSFDYIRFFSRLPLVSPLIWLVWVNSQRNAHLVRIQEEYAHKASVALAFEGYQRKVDDSNDPDIKKLLLELSVANLGENPVNLFDKQVKISPVEDSILSRIMDKFFPKKQ